MPKFCAKICSKTCIKFGPPFGYGKQVKYAWNFKNSAPSCLPVIWYTTIGILSFLLFVHTALDHFIIMLESYVSDCIIAHFADGDNISIAIFRQ